MHVGRTQGKHLGCASSSGIISVVGKDTPFRNNFDFAIPLLQKPPLNGTFCKNKFFIVVEDQHSL